MATVASFFSELWFKRFLPVSNTVDYEDIFPFIQPAQDQYIKPKVGTLLYARLVQSVIDADYTADELELIELIRPAAAFYTAYLALPFLGIKIRNKGVIQGTDQFLQTVSRQDLLSLRQEFLEMASYYLSRITDYLCDNSQKFPLYTAVGNDKVNFEDYDFGGFIPYKGWGLSGDTELIKKVINYKKY